MPSFQICRSPGQILKLIRFGSLHLRGNWGLAIYGGSYVVNLFKQKVLSQKIDDFGTEAMRSSIFFIDFLIIFNA